MNLNGHTVEITVIEPFEWIHENIIGIILSIKNDNRLIVKLPKLIKGDKLQNDLIELKPRYKGETFNNLLLGSSIIISGALIAENSEKFEYLFIGKMKVT